MAQYDEDNGVWRTIGGRRVFIKKGQSLSDAMKESGKFKKKDDDDNNPPSTSAVKKDDKEDYIAFDKKMKENIDRVNKEYDEELTKARELGDDKLEAQAREKRQTELKKYQDMKNENLANYKEYRTKQNSPIQDMADDRVKEKQNNLQMNKMLLENMNKNNIDKLPDGTTKDDLEFKIWENQKYIDTANDNFDNLKKNTISEAEKEKYMKDNNLTMFTSRDEYNYLKNKEKQSSNMQDNYKEYLKKEDAWAKRNLNDDEYKEYVSSHERKYGKGYLDSENTKKVKNTPEYEKLRDAYGYKYDKEPIETTNETMNDVIREKASKKSTLKDDLPKHTEIKTQGTSNRKEVSENIQAHILDYYDSPQDFIEQMDAMSYLPTKWKAGEELAKGGSYLIYNGDMSDFLNELKINPKGKTFSDDKAFDMYTSLVGRESAKLYDRLQKNEYNKYKQSHPLTKMTLQEFIESRKK